MLYLLVKYILFFLFLFVLSKLCAFSNLNLKMSCITVQFASRYCTVVFFIFRKSLILFPFFYGKSLRIFFFLRTSSFISACFFKWRPKVIAYRVGPDLSFVVQPQNFETLMNLKININIAFTQNQ